MIGQTVSHYRVLAQLGAGGMGVVYDAEDTRLRRRVALKFLPPDAVAKPSTLERFRREAKAASALNHPHICTIYDIGEAGGSPFIVMEKLEGESLAQLVRKGPVPLERLVDIGAGIADALAAAHDAGIVHRDVKSANVFVTSRGHAKLLDFGLAQLDSAGSGPVGGDDPTMERLSGLTVPGTTLGTIAYMSPEQARGEEVDARSDVFSLGVVLYEMATGRIPFGGATPAVILDGVLNREPPVPSVVNPDIPPAVDRIIQDALEKKRDLRTQTAGELRAALQRARRGSASAASLPLPVGRRAARWWAVAAGLILIGGIVALAVTMRKPAKPALQAPAATISRPVPAGSPAEETFLRGRYYMQRDQTDEAIAAYEEAVRLDPKLGAVWAELARAYAARTYFEGDAESERKAFVAVERGLSLDPGRAEIYAARADLLWTRSNGFPHADALRDLRHALDLDPNLAEARTSASRILQHVGLHAQSQREAGRALELRPNNRLLRIGAAWGLMYARQCDEALTVLRQFDRDDPGIPLALACLGRISEAARASEEILRDAPDPLWNSMHWATLALTRAKSGDSAGAREAIRKAIETGREVSHFHHTAHLIAVTYAVLGDKEASLDWLERTAREGFPSLHTFMVDPDLAGVRGDDRFKRLAKQIDDQQRELQAIFP